MILGMSIERRLHIRRRLVSVWCEAARAGPKRPVQSRQISRLYWADKSVGEKFFSVCLFLSGNSNVSYESAYFIARIQLT